jgi:hypothetical protein
VPLCDRRRYATAPLQIYVYLVNKIRWHPDVAPFKVSPNLQLLLLLLLLLRLLLLLLLMLLRSQWRCQSWLRDG